MVSRVSLVRFWTAAARGPARLTLAKVNKVHLGLKAGVLHSMREGKEEDNQPGEINDKSGNFSLLSEKLFY